jgi:hypothetical protein
LADARSDLEQLNPQSFDFVLSVPLRGQIHSGTLARLNFISGFHLLSQKALDSKS